MLNDAGFFVTLSFLIFLWVFLKKGWGVLLKMMDTKIHQIQENFNTLQNARDKAMLERDAVRHSLSQLDEKMTVMIEETQKRVELIHAQSREELSKLILNRKDGANEKIKALKASFERLIFQELADEITQQVIERLRACEETELSQKALLKSLQRPPF